MARRIDEDLVRELLAQEGDPHPVTTVEFDKDDRRIVVSFAGTSAQATLTPRSGQDHPGRTSTFDVGKVGGAPFRDADELRWFEGLDRRVRSRDTGGYAWGRKPCLYLVPGDIANGGDLGAGPLEALRRAAVIVVEPGKVTTAREWLARAGIAADGKELAETPADADAAEAFLAARATLDVALFGVDEGLPGFCDPGKELVSAADARGLRVRTTAGPSALAMALLRLPFDVGAFVFLGVAEVEAGVAAHLDSGQESPVLAFLTADADGVARRVASASLARGADVYLLANLTSLEEWVVRLRPGDEVSSLRPVVPADRVVLAVCPRRRRGPG